MKIIQNIFMFKVVIKKKISKGGDMKKLILFFAVFSITAILVFSCSKGNGPDDNNTHTDTTDRVAPFISLWQPARGAIDVSVGATVYVSICDTGAHASGLNADSSSMRIKGLAVVPSLIANACGGFDMRYIPPDTFLRGDTVGVFMRVRDNAQNLLSDSSWFVIIPQSAETETVIFSIDTLPPIAGFATRSRPGGITLEVLYFPSLGSSFINMGIAPPYHLAFTHGRSWLLADPDGDIWAFNPNLGISTRLTNSPAIENYPALSPDGRTLAFARGYDLMLKDLKTGDETIITTSAQSGKNFAFSADGAYVAYISGTSFNPRLYMWRLSDMVNVASPTLYNDIDNFCWGPSGSDFAIISSDKLYYWNVGGAAPRLLYSSYNLAHAVYSPAGDWIYVVDRRASGDVIVRTTPTGTVQNLYFLPAGNTIEAMSISSDGKILLYAIHSGSVYSLRSYNTQTSTETTHTSSIGQTIQIVWF